MIAGGETVYDRIRSSIDAEGVLTRLGVEVVRRVGHEVHLRPMCHESTSGESLHVNTQTGRWLCRACTDNGMNGDLIGLVEYVQTNGMPPSAGIGKMRVKGHVDALRWLCEQYAIPFDAERVVPRELEILALFVEAAHAFLLRPSSENVRLWIEKQWGFTIDVIREFQLGYLPTPTMPELITALERPAVHDAATAAGLGFFHGQPKMWVSRFDGRVLFPYLELGQPVYLIGRATPWTPRMDDGRAPSKYYKLPTHSESNQRISARIRNDHLFGEGGLVNATRAVMTEGVADAVALIAAGVEGVVSPVGLSAREEVIDGLVKKLKKRGIEHIDIAFDSELSGAGSAGARATAERIVKRGLSVSIVNFPLGAEQEAARDEVLAAIGQTAFDELELADRPADRRKILEAALADPAKREWISSQIGKAKIDAAEWVAKEGAAALERFQEIRQDAVDYIDYRISKVAVDPAAEPEARLRLFDHIIALVAAIDSRIRRSRYAGSLSKAAGRYVTKADVDEMISAIRKTIKEERKKAEALGTIANRSSMSPILIPPPLSAMHTTPGAPPPPLVNGVPPDPNMPPDPNVPPPPGGRTLSEYEHFSGMRRSVLERIENKCVEDEVAKSITQAIETTMGFTAFRAPDDLYLVRGNERIPVGLTGKSPKFMDLLYTVGGLLNSKTSHRGYIQAVQYHIGRGARDVHEVSWSHVDDSGSVFFPLGDGRLVKISSGTIGQTRMAEAKVPAIGGPNFRTIKFLGDARGEIGGGGILNMLNVFRWASLSAEDTLVLVHWITCLPILRRIGIVPIVRIEGGSGTGKTRTVNAVSWLVNGCETASVPTAAALMSRLSTEMLTIDDNRETKDVSPAFLGTLLQATNLGAREKRRGNTDTGTVVERVCGALLMNGIEPIHCGQSEIASRMLTFRCLRERREGSPASDMTLRTAVLDGRDAFWTESLRRCAAALELDAMHGEKIGALIEDVFRVTRIGRLSSYLRMMYLVWVVGLPDDRKTQALSVIDPGWMAIWSRVSGEIHESLIREELVVESMRYVFSWAAQHCTVAPPIGESFWPGHGDGLDGIYFQDQRTGEAYLGWVSATKLCRLMRRAGHDLSGPRTITEDLRAGQLESRIMDGIVSLSQAGFEIIPETDVNRRGWVRFTVHRHPTRGGQAALGANGVALDAPGGNSSALDGGRGWLDGPATQGAPGAPGAASGSDTWNPPD